MAQLDIVIDARQVIETFNRAPVRFLSRLNDLIYDGAVDVQREMRINAPVGATGDLRRTVDIERGQLSARVSPTAKHAPFVEKGTRPHWTSARPGTALHRWATHKGLNPYAVQRSIAMKGTKPNPFVQPTYVRMAPRVKRDVVNGIMKFVGEVNSGAI